MSIDMYSEKVADASALIREFAKCEYFEFFARNPEDALKAFIAMQDAAEAKSAARIADLEAQVSALKAAGGVPEDELLEAENKGYAYGRRGGLLEAASVARELYCNHCHHHGVNGLLDRCKDAEQVLITLAEKEPVAAPQAAEQTKPNN
jgi:hypothetical protein